jgi:Protein of unknown function (DUF3618)
VSTHEHTAQELRKEIEATRRELGTTVEQLAHRTAIKARLRDRVEDVEHDLKRTLARRSVEVVSIGGAVIVLLIGWNLMHSRALDT